MGSKFKKAVSIAMVGTILMSSPAIASFAEVAAQKVQKFTQNRAVIEDGPCIYLTAPPKLQVGDSIDINFAGVTAGAGLYSGGTVTWYRGTGQTGDAIPDATGFSYTLTDEDVGYYIYATVERDIEGETLLMKSGHLGQTAAFVEEVENWVVDGDWEYDELNEGGVQIRFRRLDDKGNTYYGSNDKLTVIPSTIGGHTVVKLADNAFSHCYITSGYAINSTITVSSNLPKTLREIGDNVFGAPILDSKILVIPESVVYIKDSFQRYMLYTGNSSPARGLIAILKIKVQNPSCHIEVLPEAADSYGGGKVTYAGAKGSSIENVYWKEVAMYLRAGLSTPHNHTQAWEQQGVYHPNSGLTLTKGELTQQDLDNNIKDWETSTDGKFDKDVIDGREDLVIKPNDIKGNDVIEIPDSLDGKEVGAVEVDTSGKPNVVIKVPDNVYIDRDSTIDSSTIISGATGSDAEDFAKDNDLVFEAIDKELTTKEEFDNAKKSNWITSKDGYWQYRFINGFAGVEIKNIKSFGVDAIVEVPELIDGNKTVVFYGQSIKDTYKSMDLHEKIVIISQPMGYGIAGMGFYEFVCNTKNITIYNKNMDLSVYDTENAAPKTFTGWLGSTTEAICNKRNPNQENTKNFIFIPLDRKTELQRITISGYNKVGYRLTANLNPTFAFVELQWLVSNDGVVFTDITGATTKELKLTEDFAGKIVKIKAVGTGNFSGTVESDALSITTGTKSVTGLSVKNDGTVGNVVTAVVTPEGATVDYQWYRYNSYSSGVGLNSADFIPSGAVKIEGATEMNYQLTVQDYGNNLFVTAIGKENFYSGWRSSTISVKGNLQEPTISGTYKVGETLTAKAAPVEAQVTYQWFKSEQSIRPNYYYPDVGGIGEVPSNYNIELIEGATESSYTLDESCFNKYVGCIIKGNMTEGYAGDTYTAATHMVGGRIANIEVTGFAYVGQELGVKILPDYLIDESVLRYNWYIVTNSTDTYLGNPIASTKNYTVKETDLGKYLLCEVSTITTLITGATSERVLITKCPDCEIIGETHQISDWYLVKKETCTTDRVEAQRCLVCEKELATRETTKATGHHFEVIGDKIVCTNIVDCTITIINDSAYPWTLDENGVWRSNIKALASKSTNLSLDFTLSETTDISFDLFANGESSYDYIYYTLKKDGVDISGTGESTKTSDGDATKYLTMSTADLPYTTINKTLDAGNYNLTFTYKKDGSGDRGLDSGFVRNIKVEITCGAEKVLTAITNISLSGNTEVGSTLNTLITPSTATADFAWHRADSLDGVWEQIEGATGASYTLTVADTDKFVKVLATGTGEYAGSQEDITSSVVVDPNASKIPMISRVSISGVLNSGETLKTTVYSVDAKADITWLVADTADGEFTELATGSTYILTDAEVGKFIKVLAVNTEVSTNKAYSTVTGPIKEANSTGTTTGRIPNSTEDVDYVQEDLTDKGFDETLDKDVEVYASQGQSFTVRVPKRIVMNGGKDMNNTSNFVNAP